MFYDFIYRKDLENSYLQTKSRVMKAWEETGKNK